MLLRVFYKILFLLILSISLYAQSVQIDSTKADTVFFNKENLLRLKLNTSIKSNPFYYDFSEFGLYNQTFLLKNLSNYYSTQQQNIPLEMLPNLYKSNKNLQFALKEQYRWRTEDKLGIIGQVLGYVNFAAVGYLLYEHIRRYKDEYKEDYK